ncbi:hypothetical protein DXG01_002300 [Tephrocybe rancida]|nr:hypothetical protein DXG01_002300 [Tephrocybe rancida]
MPSDLVLWFLASLISGGGTGRGLPDMMDVVKGKRQLPVPVGIGENLTDDEGEVMGTGASDLQQRGERIAFLDDKVGPVDGDDGERGWWRTKGKN